LVLRGSSVGQFAAFAELSESILVLRKQDPNWPFTMRFAHQELSYVKLRWFTWLALTFDKRPIPLRSDQVIFGDNKIHLLPSWPADFTIELRPFGDVAFDLYPGLMRSWH
jgi:hypothetical protein